ncbi:MULTISPECIES: MlaD family protein [unclassified Nocardia]|uniref:MlaD family protein n=1 Tax=unclassified Nocardia TaxID=2637762 RepID=UPI0033A7AAEB
MTHTARSLRWAPLTVVLTAVLTTAGCGFDPAAVPVPGTGVPGPTYSIDIEFTDALNLPRRAKVVANGIQVGTVTATTLVDPAPGRPGHVRVNAEIQQSVPLPTSTAAELRQNTVLGDIHVALRTPPDGFGALLADGGTIPLARTRPAVPIEDAMAGMATFVQGGAVNKLQDMVNRLNAVLPDDPRDTARISGVIGADIRDLAANLDQVDVFLNGLATDAAVVHRRDEPFGELLTPPAVAQVTAAITSFVGAIGVIGALGPVAHALVWLAPLVSAGDAAARALVPLAFTARPLDLDAPSNLNALVSLLRDKVIPFAEHGPKVDVVRVGLDDPVTTEDQVDRIVETLRMIGMVR